MTLFKKLALATAFAAFSVTGAQAADIDTGFRLDNLTAGTANVATGTYLVGNTGPDINGDPVAPRVKNDTFLDEFILQIQDAQDVSFFVASGFHFVSGKVVTDVTFSSFSLTDLTGFSIFLPDDADFEAHSGSADWLGVGSGTYDLRITGTINADGGQYGGELGTVPSVPEPTGWALMLAGLGAMGMLARRRKHQG